MKRGHLLLVVLLSVFGCSLPTLLSSQSAPPAAPPARDSARPAPATFAFDTTKYRVLEQACATGTFRIAYPPVSAPGTATPFGSTVAYRDRWSPGGAGPTYVFTSLPLTLNGKLLPAGKYVLLTIPDTATWRIILNANPTTTARNYPRQDDVLTLTAPATDTLAHQGDLSFTATGKTDRGFTLQLRYGTTGVTLAVIAPDPLEEYGRPFEGKPPGPDGATLLSLGRYIHQEGKDPAKALSYVERSIAWAETCHNLYYKGVLLVEMGRQGEAVDWLIRARDRAEAEGVDDLMQACREALEGIEER